MNAFAFGLPSGRPDGESDLWRDAVLAASVLAVDPLRLGGLHLRARHGPVRDLWLGHCLGLMGEVPRRRIAASTAPASLIGGLDMAATLAAVRPVIEPGVLVSADGGVVVAAMAERMPTEQAAILATALDHGVIRMEREGLSSLSPARFCLIALDEGADGDETIPARIGDRLALSVDLTAIGMRHAMLPLPDINAVAAARTRLPMVQARADIVEAFCIFAAMAGQASLRTPMALLRVARIIAALAGADEIGNDHAATAIRLVLGRIPALGDPPPEEQMEPEVEPDENPADDASAQDEGDEAGSVSDLTEMLVAATRARLPFDVMTLGITPSRRGGRPDAGRAGIARREGRRGRQVGVCMTPPTPGAPLDILATLRAAAPWQRLRHATVAGSATLAIRKQDFRYRRYREPTETLAIFVVDASGSSALDRLGEAKGAIELLLGACYVRRDQVALIAFRGTRADILLPPTRSLVRAKRALTELPGGGGTPLAAGLDAAFRLARQALGRGQNVVTVVLTDGRGNVALDGQAARDRAAQDAERVALRFKAAAHRAILIDTSARPQPRAASLAASMGAHYLPLPHGRPEAMSAAIVARMADAG